MFSKGSWIIAQGGWNQLMGHCGSAARTTVCMLITQHTGGWDSSQVPWWWIPQLPQRLYCPWINATFLSSVYGGTWMRDVLFSCDASSTRFIWCLILISIWGSNSSNKLVLWWVGFDWSIHAFLIISKLVRSIKYHFKISIHASAILTKNLFFFSKHVSIMLLLDAFFCVSLLLLHYDSMPWIATGPRWDRPRPNPQLESHPTEARRNELKSHQLRFMQA